MNVAAGTAVVERPKEEKGFVESIDVLEYSSGDCEGRELEREGICRDQWRSFI